MPTPNERKLPLPPPGETTLMPSSPLRKRLRAEGHVLKPILRIGTSGVTEGVILQVRSALAIHELIKITVSADAPVDRFEIAEQLAKASILIAQVIGRTILAYAPLKKKKVEATEKSASGNSSKPRPRRRAKPGRATPNDAADATRAPTFESRGRRGARERVRTNTSPSPRILKSR